MDSSLKREGVDLFFDNEEELEDALLSREWRVLQWAIDNAV